MQKLVESIERLKNSEIKKKIDYRIKEFKEVDRESNNELFRELCFCILTANYNAEKCIKIQRELGDYIFTDPEKDLQKKLRLFGYRYPNVRAGYIVDSRKFKDSLKNIVKSYNGNQLRDWFVKNIKGLGYKEASHFLRNIGFDNYAIIDFHIVDILVRHKIIKKPKTITKKKYLEIENILKHLAKKLDLKLSDLDLYLWYIETGKILK